MDDINSIHVGPGWPDLGARHKWSTQNKLDTHIFEDFVQRIIEPLLLDREGVLVSLNLLGEREAGPFVRLWATGMQ